MTAILDVHELIDISFEAVCIQNPSFAVCLIKLEYEPHHQKSRVLPIRKQRHRSAVQ